MHKKIKLLLLSLMVGISSYAYAAQLTTAQQKLKNNTIVALYLNVCLKYNVRLDSYSKEEMQSVEKQCLAHVEDLLDSGIELPENVARELREFGESLELAYEIEEMEKDAQAVVPREQMLGCKPQIINP